MLYLALKKFQQQAKRAAQVAEILAQLKAIAGFQHAEQQMAELVAVENKFFQ
jgi:cell fate (sporulation/competence/biofilm development) regulator YmcA (YheA/YmcA/DUF963 family)